jgi:hypothetical protein
MENDFPCKKTFMKKPERHSKVHLCAMGLCMGFPILIEPKKRKEGKDANHTVTVDAALVLGHL